MRVCLGGTFDRFHVGHELLLRRAFEVGSEVFIGVTSQRLAQAHRKRKVRPFAQRLRAVESFLRKNRLRGVVSEIDHPFGRSIEERYEGIVVSPETFPRVKEINAARKKLGLRPLRVFTITYVYSEDGLRITATRIADGEIDAGGRRRAPLKVAVGTHNALKSAAVQDAFQRAFPKTRIQVRAFPVPSGVPEQPKGPQTIRGAQKRAERALADWKDADYGVGVEAGLLRDSSLRRWTDVQYAVVVDKQGGQTAAHGGGFYYPATVTHEVLKGRTISEVLGPLAKDRRLGSTTGAVGFLSRGALDRLELTTHAVLLALVPRLRRDLYQE